MNTPDNTKVAVLEGSVTGAIFVAPTSVALPTSGTTTLPATYKTLGFTSDDGITISEDSSSNDIRAWEGHQLVRSVKTEYTENIAFTPIECNEDVAKLIWGDDAVTVAANGSLTIKHHGRTLEPVNIVIEAIPFEGAVARYTARVQLDERGEVAGNGSDASGRELTFKCIPVDGVTMTEYIAYTSASSGSGSTTSGS